jgi:hypothetical protein
MAAPAQQRATPQKLARFLVALAETGNVRLAASRCTLDRATIYRYRQTHPDFAQAWKDALESAMELVLEPEAMRRAVTGVKEPVYYQGQQVGAVQRYSDTLLIFLLKGGLKEKYAERTEHTGKEGGPIQVAAMAPEARQARVAVLMAKRTGQLSPAAADEEASA